MLSVGESKMATDTEGVSPSPASLPISLDQSVKLVTCTIDPISDVQLLELAFTVYMKRAAFLLTGTNIISDPVEEEVKYAVQVLWTLLKKSSHPLRQKFAQYISSESQLIISTLKTVCICLESKEPFRRESQLHVCTQLLHLLCNSLTFQHRRCIQNFDDRLINTILESLKYAASSMPLNIPCEQVMAATVLMLYLCMNKPSVLQLLRQSHSLQIITSLVRFSSTEIRVLSKALVARLIPANVSTDDMAELILIQDDEVDHLISVLTSKQSYNMIPIVSVMMDLSRSPHNITAFVSKSIALALSDSMDSFCEEDQAMAAQLIWTIMEFNYEATEDVSLIVKNGSLHDRPTLEDGDQPSSDGFDSLTDQMRYELSTDFLSYIVEYNKLFEANSKTFNTSSIIGNLSAAIVLQHNLMQYDEKFREEIVSSISHSSATFLALHRLTSLLCIVHLEEATKAVSHDVHLIVLKCLVWWTCHSDDVSAGLSRTGIITNICNLLPIFIQLNIFNKVYLCLKVLINCASDPANLPAFNTTFNQSDVIVSVLPLTHGQQPVLAHCSKMLLALLSPLLDHEQLRALKLTRNEANSFICLLNEAIENPYHLAQDSSLLTFLRCMIWFTHEYNRKGTSLDRKVCSDYQKVLDSVTLELEHNSRLLLEEGLLSVLKCVLKLDSQQELQSVAIRLVWCLSHENSTRTAILKDPDIIRAVKCASSPELSVTSYCTLYLLGFQSSDHQSLLLYANGCLKLNNYVECIEVCDVIIKAGHSESNSTLLQAKITKGKACFYAYKRKLQYILVDDNIVATKEGRILLYNECFNSMMEAIALLGNGLDQNLLDEEGSKLLDWAMFDCLSTTNQLNKCKRCLLCRQKTSLSKSHVWPEFIAKTFQDYSSDEKNFIFGLDKHQLKSAGSCTYWMLCSRCEELLSQNGESDFNDQFPTTGKISYSPWLFSFCAGMIFRCLSIAVQFPMHFNDDEIYKVLLLCRKHLLSLPVKINHEIVSLSEHESKQLERLNEQLKELLHVYLFISPLKSQQNYGSLQAPYPVGAFAISRNKKLDTNYRGFNGYAHFFLLCCGPITLIVQFDESVHALKNKGFHITSNQAESDQTYIIPSEEDCVKLLPLGVWTLVEQLTEGTINDFQKVSRFISPGAKKPTLQSVPSAPSVNTPVEPYCKTMFQMSFLPKGYEIREPHVNLPRNECVILPKGHHVIIHATRVEPIQNAVMTFILCTDGSKSPPCIESHSLYMIIVLQYNKHHIQYIDSTMVEIKNNKLVLTGFSMRNEVANALRTDLSQLQSLLNITLPNKHFDNINLLMQLVNYRRCITGQMAEILPSLDRRCCSKGCWYCRDLCHHCMKPSSTLYSGVYQNEILLKFCSDACKLYWFPNADIKPPLRATSFLDKSHQSQQTIAPMITVINDTINGVEQIYLSAGALSEDEDNLKMPYIVWHIREVQHQHFAHFYISKDCLPLKPVWVKHYCTSESEAISDLIATKRLEIQSQFQMHLTKAVQMCGFENLESFMQAEYYQPEISKMVPEEVRKAATQSNLPVGYTFINPKIGFAHGSLKSPMGITDLLHYTKVDEYFQTMYILAVSDLFDDTSTKQLQLITVKHSLEEGWYLADGVLLSSGGVQFLSEKPVYSRGPQALEEMNGIVQKIVPDMLRQSGVPSIPCLLRLTKYTWFNSIRIKPDLPCSSSVNCWYCTHYCHCCSYFLINPANDPEFCCEECRILSKQDPSTIPPVIFSQAELEEILKSKNEPLIAFMKKVVSTESDRNTVLRIYLIRSDNSFEVIPLGTLLAICQIKTASTQVVVDCLLSKDFKPLKPVWYSKYCEEMIMSHCVLLQHEISYLSNKTSVTFS